MAGESGHPHRLKGLLSITVLKAKGLKKADLIGNNDNYVVLSLEPLANTPEDKCIQTETYQKTQIHDGLNPIFNEKFIFPVAHRLEALYIQIWDSDNRKDDLVAQGTLSLIDDEQGGRLDTNLNKEWLHIVEIGLTDKKGRSGGSIEFVLHFIPETVADYMGKKFDATQAEIKKKLTQRIVGKVTDVASDKIRAYVGLNV
ncbi:hypothetical protein I4U23_020508 [Adineta vaga]|nr:hypothetical protein I4U23_020508 [Adineta vaga]